MTVLGIKREGGDEARWGGLKLGHAADRECRAVGRARSSSAAPRPEGVAGSPAIRRERRRLARSLLRRPLRLRAPARENRVTEARQWKSAGERSDAPPLRTDFRREIASPRDEGRRDLALSNIEGNG